MGYHPTVGRWIERDPGPDSAPAPTREYADGMNLYQYVGSNPVLYVDPSGMWRIERKKEATAIATTTDDNDTVESLAAQINLKASQWELWLQPANPDSQDSYSIRTVGSQHKACGTFKIPNTILAAWAGWEGFGQGFGKFWVMWGKDVDDLKAKGFAVDEKDNLTASSLLGEIRNLSSARALHGFLFWGHGPGSLGILTKENEGSNPDYSTDYYSIGLAAIYKLGFAMIYACYGCDGINPIVGGIVNDGAPAWGGPDRLVPLPFHLSAPTVNNLLPSGAQGTIP